MSSLVGRRSLAGPGTAATLALLIAIALPSTAQASAATDRAEQLRYANETMNLGNGQFMARKADFLRAKCGAVDSCTKPSPYNKFDWSTDGCSPPTLQSWRTLFNQACEQHDFGYRNYGKNLTLGRNEPTRAWIDGRFRTEMKSICNYKFSNWTQYANLQACFKEADVMYSAVRLASNWSRP